LLSKFARVLAVVAVLPAVSSAQTVLVYPADRVFLPTTIDGNSPAFWWDGLLRLFTSTGNPEMISTATNPLGPWTSQRVDVTNHHHIPLWIESAWVDEEVDGTVFGWYHHEPEGVCGNGLTAPKIGAVLSFDGGNTIEDLGIVLESGDEPDCSSQNGFFAGGHGDFSVVFDAKSQYFYFFFTNYIGPDESQGIVVARLAYLDRYSPAGAVQKYYNGEWLEPGIGGRMTAIFPAATNWQSAETDSFWGPSVHWNKTLRQYVMLLNHACCDVGWIQEGIYMSFGSDITNPASWSYPAKMLEGGDIPKRPAFYPQILGLGEKETDSLAGSKARLYVQGQSDWELEFLDGGWDVGPPGCPVSPKRTSKPVRVLTRNRSVICQ